MSRRNNDRPPSQRTPRKSGPPKRSSAASPGGTNGPRGPKGPRGNPSKGGAPKGGAPRRSAPKGAPERLQKRLASIGVASRRESERYITAGRVRVNGKTVTELGTKVMPDDRIEVDGAVVEAPTTALVLALDKPEGVVCTRSDPEGRETIYDLLGESLPFMAHVGRLDIMTSGLLLMTTDGDLAKDLLDPGFAVPRVYHVKVRGNLDASTVKQLERGVTLDGHTTRPAAVEKLPSSSKHDWIQLTLFEGKNRHVRRVIEAVGHSVTKLRRVAFGSVTVDGLRPGEWRLLEPSEIARLRGCIQN